MQIVRNLAGYTLGRSDLVRRAMSKKKTAVMEKERQYFVYGSEENKIPGCIQNGISEIVANKIYDDMIDFAKYAFNKSHAAAYAVVSYQTAYLKYYYPVEFMAALMTSVIDNPGKVSEYILSCRQMGIDILPPDVNKGETTFSVDGQSIRYALSAIKNIGKSVIQEMTEERNQNGTFQSLSDFLERMSGKEMNKRAVENLIKAGALDSVGGTRKQLIQIYAQVMEQVAQNKKNSLSGQMSLFDFMGEEEKKEFEIVLPNVGEYDKEQLLAFEKEVLGIYISGHPMQNVEKKWRKYISNVSMDFQLDDETGHTKVADGSKATIGGMLIEKTIKYTRNNKTMAFLTIEDLVGTVEVVVFPKDYEKYHMLMNEDDKVLIQGRVNTEDDKASKLICEKMWTFDQMPSELWIQFETKEAYQEQEDQLMKLLKQSDGNDQVVVYIKNQRAIKRLPGHWSVKIEETFIQDLRKSFGADNVKVVD